MTRIQTPLSTIPLLTAMVLLSACGRELPGTQVGIEHGAGCQLVATEALTDLDATLEGFTATPREILDALPGTFRGPLLGAEEVPMEGEATLTVGLVDEALSLEQYEPMPSDSFGGQPDLAAFCPPRLLLTIEIDLAADGFPAFAGTMDAAVFADDEAGDGWSITAVIDPTDHLDGELPDPVVLDPDAVDVLTPRLRVGGITSSWGVDLSWVSETDDGLGEDGAESRAMITELIERRYA